MKNFDSMELNATPHAPENPEAVRINGARPESRSFDNGWAQQRANAQAERSLYQDSEYIARTCRDCGKEFLMGREEMEWFWSRDMVTPRRCPACRGRNKTARLVYRDMVKGYGRSGYSRRPEGRGVNIHG